ncbi:hypothetical protein R6242_21115 [Iodobacter sp. CM08]|uniref:hypothetical protein n=1 Tax=Iodobacter sp. CM08 TaxID=3085902 RepID=UPI002981CDEB|nr:hypothetical protein [Iodobacter sp. CM08]MDW5419076.1 hypothetical protein [Iodobacter sp. CM08]
MQSKKNSSLKTADSFPKEKKFMVEAGFISIINNNLNIGQNSIGLINSANSNYFAQTISKLIDELNIEWSKKNLPTLDYYLANFIIWASHNISGFLLEDEKQNLLFIAERFLYGFFPAEKRGEARTFAIDALDLSWKIAWKRACDERKIGTRKNSITLVSSLAMAKINQKNKMLEALHECNLLFSCTEFNLSRSGSKVFVTYEPH